MSGDLACSNNYFGTLMVILYFPHSFCIYNSVGRVASFHPFILLCIYISIVLWIIILFYPILSLVLWFKLLWLWAFKSPSGWLLCPFVESNLFKNYFQYLVCTPHLQEAALLHYFTLHYLSVKKADSLIFKNVFLR